METLKRSFTDALMDIDIDGDPTLYRHSPKKKVPRKSLLKRCILDLEDQDHDKDGAQRKRVCVEIEQDFDRLSLSSSQIHTKALVPVPKIKLNKIGGMVGLADPQNPIWQVYLTVEDVTDRHDSPGNGQLILWKGKQNPNVSDAFNNLDYSVLEVDESDRCCDYASSLDIEILES